VPAREPIRPYPAVDVGQRFAVKPKIEALAVVKGEYVCSNDDLIRNAAYSWSPMSADEISQKTGIEERRYTGRELEEISLDAARAALCRPGSTGKSGCPGSLSSIPRTSRSSAVTQSPAPATARPSTSRPGPMLPTDPGANAVSRIRAAPA